MANILVADDEEELLEMIRFSLNADGHKVTTARDGKQALETARKGTFDLIILDVMMPHVDGYHVASEITGDPKAPPVLLLTSRDFDQDQRAVQASGASAFLSKPFEIPELLKTVRDLTTRGE